VNPVVEALTNEPGYNSASATASARHATAKPVNWERKSRRRIKQGIDLLDDDVFTYFEALNSGLVLSGKGICSLNCGGACAMCRQFAAAARARQINEECVP
jgi:hypothetical protein